MSDIIHVLVEHLRGEVSEISYVALAAARSAAEGTGAEVVAVLLGHDAESLANDLAADRVLYVDDPALAEYTPGPYLQALTSVIGDQRPRAVVCGDTSIGAEVAGGLSGRLGVPLVSRCLRLTNGDGGLRFTSQVCGGKILAEGELPSETTLVTMVPGGHRSDEGRSSEPAAVTTISVPALEAGPVVFKGFAELEAGAIDITKADVLVAVGRGIQLEGNLELAEDLAGALGGVVCASRPLIDQGWVPTAQMVGKSGQTVKPSVYLAFGISGAPEHVEGMRDSEVTIAVNVDPAAPIFDVADYGTEVDALDLLPVLIEKVREAKGA